MKEPRFYNLTPAKGQALLNFQGRRMPDTVELFETTVIEEVRQRKNASLLDGEKQKELNSDFRNLLIHGDCLSACAYLKSQNIKIDLVYIDPPFASGANYAKKIYLRNGGKTSVENEGTTIGEEIMYGDIWQKEDYLNWLYERLLSIRDTMSPTASIYMHTDWHVGHYAKILMDEVFGEDNFVNEIVWHYYNKMAPDSKCFPRSSDRILLYSLNNTEYLFNKQLEQRDVPKKQLLRKFVNGKAINVRNLEGEVQYRDSTEKRVDDVWRIPMLQPADQIEPVDYSTQKPELLLKRVIDASSEEGMIVADFFSGSGTTAKVSFDNNRRFISCDVGINAIQTSRDRLKKAGSSFDMLKINDGIRLFRNPTQTVEKLFSLIDGFTNRNDLELNEFWDGGIAGKKGSFLPLKFIGLDKKLTKQLVDVILEEIYLVEESSEDAEGVKIIYATRELDVDQDYINAGIRKSGKSTLKVELISLDDLLGQKADMLFTPDNAEVTMKKDGKWWKVEIKQYFSSYLKAKVDEFNSNKVKKQNADELFDEKGGSTDTKTKHRKITISKSGLELIESVQFDTTLKKNVWTSDLDIEDKAGIKEKIRGVYRLKTNKFKMKIRNIAGDEIVLDSQDI